MSRPTRYCEKCGEYVAEEIVTRRVGGLLETTTRLVHIDADGKVIHRGHAAKEEGVR